MASLGKSAPIIIKRVKKRGHGGHHGGSWKIAYADFVTAMMAFFLLMWLLAYTDPGTKAGIAQYFNRPLKSLLANGPGATPTTIPQTSKQRTEQQKREEQRKLQELKNKLQALVESNPRLRAFKNQIRIDITSEGLRIQIVDQKNRPMFAVGSAELKTYTKEILDRVAPTLNEVPNPISIAGHTDALTYAGGEAGYSNWELSADRANAARRELLAAGMRSDKVMQVRGLAGSVPLNRDLNNPANRRISIVVLNSETVERLKRDGVEDPASARSASDAAAAAAGFPAPEMTPAPAPTSAAAANKPAT